MAVLADSKASASPAQALYVLFNADIYRSGIGAVVGTVVLIGWLITYIYQRESWREFGDTISIVIPLG